MTARTEIGAATNAEDRRRVLRAGAAGARVRRRRQPGRPLGRPRRQVRVAGLAGRHRRRRQGQRLDDGGRTAGDSRRRTRLPAAERRAAGDGHAPRALAGPLLRRARRGGRGTRRTAPPKPQDAHVLKFSRKGEFLLQIGKAGAPGANDSTTALNRPAGVDVDRGGDRGLRRRRLRQPPRRRLRRGDRRLQAALDRARPAPDRSRRVSCAKVAKDGTVYVCDRGNNRVQAFDKTGKFLKQGVVSAKTRAAPARSGTSRSRSDPQQRYPLRRRRPRSERSSSSAATRSRPSAASATAAATRARSTASAASRSTRRGTSTRVKRSKASACRSSS